MYGCGAGLEDQARSRDCWMLTESASHIFDSRMLDTLHSFVTNEHHVLPMPLFLFSFWSYHLAGVESPEVPLSRMLSHIVPTFRPLFL